MKKKLFKKRKKKKTETFVLDIPKWNLKIF